MSDIVNEYSIGSRIIHSQHGVILTGVVEAISGDAVQARLESPWGVPSPFAEWFLARDLGRKP